VPLPTFSNLVPGFLATRTEVARDQVLLTISVHPGLLAAHLRPGQFVKVRVSDALGALQDGIFAMANAPGESVGPEPGLRFLLRTNNPEGGEAAARLASMPVGGAVEISEPAGAGFDLESARGRDLCFVATGTAIAPVRAGIEATRARPVGARATSLDLGLRSPAHLAIASELEIYRSEGIDVHLHYSAPREDGTVDGALAHEALLTRLASSGRAPETLVVAVGQPAMVKDLRARFVALGGRPEDVVSNY